MTDYAGAAAGTLRVFRGGSWKNNAANCRAGYRFWEMPDNRFDNLGFRIARAPAPTR